MSGLRALLSEAERLARKRGQPPTAHVLLALYRRAEVGPLLAAVGIDEAALLRGLPRAQSEHETAAAIAFERGEKLARALGHERVGPLHLLHALVREPRCAGHALLEALGTELADLEQSVVRALKQSAPDAPAPRPASPSRESHGRARGIARPRQLSLSHAQHHLASETEGRRARERARRTSEAPAAPVPPPKASAPVRPEAKAARAPAIPSAAAASPAPAAKPKPARAPAAAPARDETAFELDPKSFPLLASLGRNLCAAAAHGAFDPVLGRDAEIAQMLDVLSRRRGSNPVLVGPAGVGKTAVVEGLAQALVRGGAEVLGARCVIELPAAALLSGTGVRGALCERLQGIVQEVARAEGRVILFIDEIHTVAGGDEGGDSVSGVLKAALARGELSCIGATTEAEYRRVFERDAALSRRFTRIEVGEPGREAALAILGGLAPHYEAHHGVPIRPEALRAAVDLSMRFMTERHLPDKAIGLIDQAAARVRRKGARVVDEAAVAAVVSEHTSVPVERLTMRDGEALLALEDHLQRRVIGQPSAVAAVAEALRKSAAGFRGARPLGTFLFLGPTGVGKTELAKAIAEVLFPGAPPTRIDMSELSEAHAIARLLGAPPGYVGHDEGGQLTEAARKRPYSLVLLDEIEKAHREVLLALLPLLDEGRLTDGRGRTVDFRNTVIVMTSNLGVRSEAPRPRVGFGNGEADTGAELASLAAKTLAAARQALPPELWNRIDEPLFFAPLPRAALVRIAHGMLASVAELAAREHGVRLVVDDSVHDALIAAGGYDPQLGARPMRRVIGKLVEAPLSRLLLSGAVSAGATVSVCGRAGQVVLEPGPAAVDAAE